MSLKFLSKKRWHVRRIENVRKVAEAEAKLSDEQTRMAELRREREEERELENIRKIQEASGRIPKQQPQLEFLYKTPPVRKRDEENIVTTEDILKGRRPDQIMIYKDDAIIKSQCIPGVKFIQKDRQFKGDEDIIMREDPLTAILAKRKKEKKEEEEKKELLSKLEESRLRNQLLIEKKMQEEKIKNMNKEDSEKRHRKHHIRHHLEHNVRTKIDVN